MELLEKKIHFDVVVTVTSPEDERDFRTKFNKFCEEINGQTKGITEQENQSSTN